MKARELLTKMVKKAKTEHTDCLYAIVRDITIQETEKRLFCFNVARDKVICYRIETGIMDCALSTEYLEFSIHDYELLTVSDIADVKVGGLK